MVTVLAGAAAVAALCWCAPEAWAATIFSTGNPDAQMAMASRPGPASGVDQETEAADDFTLSAATNVDSATFVGLLPSGAPLSSIQRVRVEIYRVFPIDSTNPPSGHVPTRVNSPSDVDFDARDTLSGTLTSVPSVLSSSVSAANSVDTGIHPSPNQTTGGEGPVSGEEVGFSVSFATPFVLPADHYFFVPQVLLSSGHFLWLSAPKPIVSPGTPFSPDLQAWARNASLDPDWLRVGTDIVGGAVPPTFNGTFSLLATPAQGPSGGSSGSNAFSFGKLKRNERKGTATLTVIVPGPGTLVLTGTGLVKQRPGGASRAERAVAKTVSAAGKVKLLIKAKGKKKRKLNRTGKVKVKAKVTYTPTGGDPNTKAKRIGLVKRR